ncbi:MAG: T9SS type A sorting domain-containing protein [Flavobacteriales bacterium]|nr:T9SS type A sorting domain-containing protein [Flavobacteriales bacterium]
MLRLHTNTISMRLPLRFATLALFTSLLPNRTSLAQDQNALDFDGIDDEVMVENASAVIAGASGFSLTCWVDPSENGFGHNGIVGLRDEAEADFYLLRLDGTNSVEARFRNSDGLAFTLVYSGLTFDTWQHLALVYNGSEMILYHNGAEASFATASGGITSTTGTLRIGNLMYNGDSFNLTGQVDEVGFWSTALSAAEVECLASSPIDGTADGLQLYYDMDQGIPGGNNATITALTDQMGNADGTLQGFGLTGPSSNFVAGQVIGFAVEGTLCAGGGYEFNGETLTTPGTYTATFASSSGCDSTVVLTLVEGEVNTNVVQNGSMLISTQANLQWQWYVCDGVDYTLIPGATAQYYQATEVGSYAVEVTQNGCSAMSACYNVTSIGIEEEELPLFTLSPVPVTDVLTVELSRTPQNASLTVLDMTGRMILQRGVGGARRSRLDVSTLTSGAYFLRVSVDGVSNVVRFVRE